MIGVYHNDRLIENLQSSDKAGDFLIEALDSILAKYSPTRLIYANGPGSFMGIKLSYIILKTISLVKSCPMMAVSGFELNGNQPIRANKNLSFVLENGQIRLIKTEPCELKLPLNLSNLNQSSDILPNYVIGAV